MERSKCSGLGPLHFGVGPEQGQLQAVTVILPLPPEGEHLQDVHRVNLAMGR